MLKYRELEVFDREVKQTQICEYRPCYVYGRTHVGTSDVAKCGEVLPTTKLFRNSYKMVNI